MASQHQWYYKQAEGPEVGPITESQFVKLIKKGDITRTTRVYSETRTKGKWYTASKVPSVAKLLSPAPPVVESPVAVPPEKESPAQPSFTQPIQPSPVQTTSVVIQREQKNTIGMVGFVLSIVAILTCGVLFPLSLLFSVIGLFYKPKAYAVAGTVISGVAVAVFAAAWVLFIGAFFAAAGAVSAVSATMDVQSAKMKIGIFESTQQRLPSDKELTEILNEIGAGESMRFSRPDDATIELVHRGLDGQFETADDLKEVYRRKKSQKNDSE